MHILPIKFDIFTFDVKQVHLKGQCHEIFDTFLSKSSTWAPYAQAKTIFQNCLFSWKMCVRADMVSEWSLTTLTPCPRSPLLCGQNVCAVVGYADTVLAQLFTTQTLGQRSQHLCRQFFSTNFREYLCLTETFLETGFAC